jgi:hypothetical protein
MQLPISARSTASISRSLIRSMHRSEK